MAGICTKFGDKANVNLMEFVCDTEDEVRYLPTTEEKGTGIFSELAHLAPLGSICIVGNEGGDLIIYELFGFGWKKIS